MCNGDTGSNENMRKHQPGATGGKTRQTKTEGIGNIIRSFRSETANCGAGIHCLSDIRKTRESEMNRKKNNFIKDLGTSQKKMLQLLNDWITKFEKRRLTKAVDECDECLACKKQEERTKMTTYRSNNFNETVAVNEFSRLSAAGIISNKKHSVWSEIGSVSMEQVRKCFVAEEESLMDTIRERQWMC